MKPLGRSLAWVVVGAMLGACFGWSMAIVHARPVTRIKGNGNTVILVSATPAGDQSADSAAESISDCASAVPTRRKAFWPDSSAAR